MPYRLKDGEHLSPPLDQAGMLKALAEATEQHREVHVLDAHGHELDEPTLTLLRQQQELIVEKDINQEQLDLLRSINSSTATSH